MMTYEAIAKDSLAREVRKNLEQDYDSMGNMLNGRYGLINHRSNAEVINVKEQLGLNRERMFLNRKRARRITLSGRE